MKIVVVQTAFLGDLVLTTPVFRFLSESYGRDKVFVVARPFARDLLLNKVIPFDKDKNKILNFFGVIKSLGDIKPQIALVPHLSSTSALIPFLARIPQRIGFEENPLNMLFDKKVKKYSKHFEHEAERIFKILDPIRKKTKNEINSKLLPEIHIEQSRIDKWKKFFSHIGVELENKSSERKKTKKIVAFAPFSNWGTKSWFWWREFLACADEFKDFIFVLIGKDKVDGDFPRNVVNLSGKTDLRDVVAILKISNIFFGVDNGLSHIASALGKACFVVFGPTVPEFGFFPFFSDFQVVEVSDLKCKPCSLHGPNSCPMQHFKCMKELTPKIVAELFFDFVKRFEKS